MLDVKLYLRRFSIVGSVHLFSAAVAFFSVAIFTRLSSVESFGNYYLVISITNIVVFPIMQSIINKTVASENTKSDISLSFLFILLIVVYYLTNLDDIKSNNEDIAVFSLFFIALCIFCSGYAEGHARKNLNFELISISRGFGLAINILCIISALFFQKIDLIFLIYFRALEYLGLSVFYFFIIKRKKLSKSPERKANKDISFTYLISLMLLYSLVNLDKIILSYIGVSDLNLGLYSLYFFSAFIITGKIYDFLNAIFFADIVSGKFILKYYSQFFRYMIYSVVLLFVCSFVLSYTILIFIGESAVSMQLVLIMALCASLCFTSQGLWLYLYGIDKSYRNLYLISLIFAFSVMLYSLNKLSNYENILYWSISPLLANILMLFFGILASRRLKLI